MATGVVIVTNAPKSNNSEEESNKIESISIDGIVQSIDSNKNVDLKLQETTIIKNITKNINTLSKQTRQTDINLNNLYTKLNTDTELGLETNLLLIENFKNLNTLDTYSSKVNSISGNTLTVEKLSGLYTNREYTITDGTSEETVIVGSIKKSGSNNIITLKNSLTKSYNTNNTMLYKSTMIITNKQAVGPGSSFTQVLSYSEVWQGIGGNTNITLPLETSHSNSQNFIVTGSGTFNNNAEFTLMQ